MRQNAPVLDALAELFEYPRAGHVARMRDLVGRIAAEAPETAADLEPLARFAADKSLGECEELYVHTFDANAERALEVGWQVFGEQYERGAFLVDLRGRMRALGVAETTELPDHLTQVLRLLGRMDDDDARTLVARAVTPSLKRVREHVAAACAYAGALEAVAKVLAAFAAAEPSESAGGGR
jgi:nitrate reductase assembly molybdenum cofactor insertion protein NarJ